MAGARAGVRKRIAGKMPWQAGARSRLSDEAVARNLDVLQIREDNLRVFGKELKDKHHGLEPKVRSLSIKFTQLPFGSIIQSCGGHFSNNSGVCRAAAISPVKLTPGKPLYFRGADFQIFLDHSPEANEFRAALENIAKKHSFVHFSYIGLGKELINFRVSGDFKPKNEKDVQECKTMNRLFLADFEKVVDQFVKKYGIGRQKLKKR